MRRVWRSAARSGGRSRDAHSRRIQNVRAANHGRPAETRRLAGGQRAPVLPGCGARQLGRCPRVGARRLLRCPMSGNSRSPHPDPASRGWAGVPPGTLTPVEAMARSAEPENKKRKQKIVVVVPLWAGEQSVDKPHRAMTCSAWHHQGLSRDWSAACPRESGGPQHPGAATSAALCAVRAEIIEDVSVGQQVPRTLTRSRGGPRARRPPRHLVHPGAAPCR